MSFKAAVLLHVDRVNNREELAQAMGMSITDLARKFKVEFGESVYSWLLKQKNKKIIYRLAQPGASVKEIVYEFGFSSAASFNKYCKKNFGNSQESWSGSSKTSILIIRILKYNLGKGEVNGCFG